MLKVTKNEKTVKGFEIETCEWEGFTFCMLKSPNSAPEAPFRPASVSDGDKVLWEYRHFHQGFHGYADLVSYLGEYFIVLINRGGIYEVVPVVDLPNMTRVGGMFIGGREINEVIRIKTVLAEKMHLKPVWTQIELQMKREINQTETMVRQQTEASAQAEHRAQQKRIKDELREQEEKKAATRAEREARRLRISKRARMHVFTKSGDHRNGIPVVGDEWMCLGDGTYCVSVSSYNDETREVGEVNECFIVVKRGGGNPRQAHISQVVQHAPSFSSSAQLDMSKLDVKLVLVDGVRKPAIVVDSVGVVKQLCTQGVNSGTYAVCPKSGEPDRLIVCCLRGGKYEVVTEFSRDYLK